MTTTSHLVCLFCVTAGQNGENLGSDEEQIVLFVYLLYDIANNKVRLCQYEEHEGLAVASIARDAVVEMTALPATTTRGKFGSEFET